MLSASSESVSAMLRALQQTEKLHVLSRPQVMTMDNQMAYVQVGERVPQISSTTVTATGHVSPSRATTGQGGPPATTST